MGDPGAILLWIVKLYILNGLSKADQSDASGAVGNGQRKNYYARKDSTTYVQKPIPMDKNQSCRYHRPQHQFQDRSFRRKKRH